MRCYSNKVLWKLHQNLIATKTRKSKFTQSLSINYSSELEGREMDSSLIGAMAWELIPTKATGGHPGLGGDSAKYKRQKLLQFTYFHFETSSNPSTHMALVIIFKWKFREQQAVSIWVRISYGEPRWGTWQGFSSPPQKPKGEAGISNLNHRHSIPFSLWPLFYKKVEMTVGYVLSSPMVFPTTHILQTLVRGLE